MKGIKLGNFEVTYEVIALVAMTIVVIVQILGK